MRSLPLLCLLLAGCAVFPLREADCRPASWQQRGYDDGYAQNDYLQGWRGGYDEWQRLMGSVDFN